MPRRFPNIPDSEFDVLEALWQIGKGSVRDVLTQLQWSGREWSYATVATLLQRLVQKKLAACDRSGFAHVYRAAISRPTVVDRRLQHLIEKVYRGDPGLLVVHLLKSHQLPPQHLHEVRQLLGQLSERELVAEPNDEDERTGTGRERSDGAGQGTGSHS